jgi:hypothetical protein
VPDIEGAGVIEDIVPVEYEAASHDFTARTDIEIRSLPTILIGDSVSLQR